MTVFPCEKIRELPLSALSGLVFYKGTFYVIADDQLSLGKFTLGGEFQITPLLPGELPLEPRMRKATKPDWESLVLLPADGFNQANLLVVPSGSKPNRSRGIIIGIAENGFGNSTEISFNDIFGEIGKSILDLNIEGTVLRDGALWFFQRGNGAGQQNAIIRCDLRRALLDDPSAVSSTLHFDLGELRGHRLGFTDACVVESGLIYFIAVAETGGSTYEDGTYVGAVVGTIDAEFKLTITAEISCPTKPEGLWIDESEGIAYVVTDADDAQKLSALYRINLKVKV